MGIQLTFRYWSASYQLVGQLYTAFRSLASVLDMRLLHLLAHSKPCLPACGDTISLSFRYTPSPFWQPLSLAKYPILSKC